MDPPEPVNLNRAILLCNLYNFFFAASKACLFPFFSLYLRLLGLTATQTGIIISLKTMVAFIFAPMWTKCAVHCQKRRLVFILSIFLMALTYLSLTLVPNQSQACSHAQIPSNDTKFVSPHILHQILQGVENQSQVTSSVQPIPSLSSIPQNVTHTNGKDDTNITAITSTDSILTPSQTTLTTSDAEDTEIEIAKEILIFLGLKKSEVKDMDMQDIYDIFTEMMSDKKMRGTIESILDIDALRFVWKIIDEGRKSGKHNDKNATVHSKSTSKASVRKKRDINISKTIAIVKEKLQKFQQTVKENGNDYAFVVVTVILIIGELFACPVEKLADDFWFDYLEKIDELEKYGKHRIWCSLAYMSFPLILTIVVSNTNCLLGIDLPGFMLHFYVFGALLGLTFLLGFFYPISADAKAKYKSKLVRGLGTTCCKFVGLLYVFTLLLVGMIYAAYYNFLFWVIQDLHGPESVMGFCITISTLAEIPMLFFSKGIIQRLGHGGVASISLVVLAGRTLYYSYLWTPWAVLPAEVLHALTHTALWYAVFNNPTFNISPVADRSIRSILSSVYFGLGFASGSFLSGLIYDNYGSNILFRVCAIAALAWCPVFFMLQKCCQRPIENEIKYTRLLQSEDLSDDEVPDDWLDKALKDR